MTIAHFLALLTIVVGVPLNLYVAVKLWRLSRQSPDLMVLRERTVVAVAVLFIVIVFSLIFINNDMTPPPILFESTKVLTRGAMLIVAIIPASYWIRLYRNY